MSNATTIEAAVSTLTALHSKLTVQLNELDTVYKTNRSLLVAELAPLTKALSALTGKPLTTELPTTSSSAGNGARKPMSAEGRENIRKALEARKARLALGAGDKVTETPAVPSAGAEDPSATPEAVAAEAISVILTENSEPVAPKVKTTALEQDVLLGGIYLNNFQDGSEGEQSIWVDQIIANGACKLVTAKQLPGVVASLSKKGLVSTDGEGILLTATGLAIAKELKNA